MGNFSASIPVASMQAANATLNAAGYGPDNFSAPAYNNANPSLGVMHSWSNAAFEAAVAAISGVVIQQALTDPVITTNAVTGSSFWAGEASPLTGNVTPGLYYDSAGKFWYVIQSYDTATWPDPTVIPALIRAAKIPGEILPWVQPIDQYDAYKLYNPFTKTGDLCTHNGFRWRVTQADGSGNNIWAPGVYGWTQW